jgi:hypothetical protein
MTTTNIISQMLQNGAYKNQDFSGKYSAKHCPARDVSQPSSLSVGWLVSKED